MTGIFDSGVGGLSVLREIMKILPQEDYIYFSDNAHCPYGDKSREYIIDRARHICNFLLEKGSDIIIVACNTATAAAISTLRAEYPGISFIGMEPAVKPAAEKTRTGVVGVLATAGTLKADKYLNTREKFADNVRVVEHVGKGFVELVEKGVVSGMEAEGIVSESLKPLLDAGADTIVLGCTHYPFLSDTIAKVAAALAPEREVSIIDPAPAVARQAMKIMKENGLLADEKREFSIRLYSSGDGTVLNNIYKTLI